MKMGQTIKGFVRYRTPWWREKYSGYSLSSTGPVVWTMDNTWRDPASGEEKLPSLMTFIAGDPAVYSGELSFEERRDLVVDQLAAIFDDPRAKSEIVAPGYVEHDWQRSHWSMGGPGAYYPPGVLTRWGPAIREPFYRIHWAGAETGCDWTGGYMNGAIEGAIRAVAEIEHQAEAAEQPGRWSAVSDTLTGAWRREHFGLRRRLGGFVQRSLLGE
jgi:monoamine oxidase